MTRTLVISDLHLGGRFFRGILTRPEPRERLLAALAGIDRLVLLGDSIELAERRPGRAMDLAEPVIRAIGTTLGADREVIVVPGNHDFQLIRAWLRAHEIELGLVTEVPIGASPALRRFVDWLAPAQVQIRYPGVWLRDDVFATHGHYLDHHLRPVSSYGRLRPEGPDLRSPAAFEQAGRTVRAERLQLQERRSGSLADLAGLARHLASRQFKDLVLRPAMSPLTSRILNFQMVHAGIPALSRVIGQLGVQAEHVIFGHLHRLGPLADDDSALWRDPATGARLYNTGSWLYEPIVIRYVHPPHAYWPGGAILLEDTGPPRPIGLLDELVPDQLRPLD